MRRWSRFLETREPNGSLERAVWKAMGGPIRVLVIGDQLPDPNARSDVGRMDDVLSTLAREPDIHVTFFPTVKRGLLPNYFPLCRVRVITDLEEHLATGGVHFDVVVVSHPHNADMIRELLARYASHAPLIYDAGSLFHRRLLVRAEVEVDPPRRDALLAYAAVIGRLELSLLKSADRVICASEIEASEVRQVTDAPVHVSDPRLEAPAQTVASLENRADLGLVAEMEHNFSSADVDLWPIVIRSALRSGKLEVVAQ